MPGSDTPEKEYTEQGGGASEPRDVRQAHDVDDGVGAALQLWFPFSDAPGPKGWSIGTVYPAAAADVIFSRESWDQRAGLPDGIVRGIVRAPDGSLAVGSDRGLVRFECRRGCPVSLTQPVDDVPTIKRMVGIGDTLVVRGLKDVAIVMVLHEFAAISGRPAGGRHWRRFEWFAQGLMDLADGPRFGDERDQADVAAAHRALEEKLLA